MDYDQYLKPAPDTDIKDTSYFQPYLDFMQKVYETMETEYYTDVSKETYDKFKDEFTHKVLMRLKDRDTVVEDIKHLGAGMLVSKLKEPSDIFTNFIPPVMAEEFKSEVLGYELGIGVTGTITDRGYAVKHVEFRSDSYNKGMRAGDIILKINDKDVKKLTQEQITRAMSPALGSIVRLEVFSAEKKSVSAVDVEVIEFFKETLATVPTGIPGMFYVKINQFNQSSGEDLTKLIAYFMHQGIDKLIIDLRGNAGGPPLAAREIASLFFSPDMQLFYFQRKNRPVAMLSTLPAPFTYQGKIAILIDQGSGSASELFAGTMRYYKRAILIGTRSAGKTFLKSMFNFEDNSMLLLVTSVAHLYNGEVYDPSGLKPDFEVTQDVDLFSFVSYCMDSYHEE